MVLIQPFICTHNGPSRSIRVLSVYVIACARKRYTYQIDVDIRRVSDRPASNSRQRAQNNFSAGYKASAISSHCAIAVAVRRGATVIRHDIRATPCGGGAGGRYALPQHIAVAIMYSLQEMTTSGRLPPLVNEACLYSAGIYRVVGPMAQSAPHA